MEPIYVLIPAIVSIIWVLYLKVQQRRIADFVMLFILSVAVITNVLLVYKMIVTGLSETEHIIQILTVSSVIPLAYTYFARQVGRQTPNNTAITVLWLLSVLSLIPGVIFYNPFEPFVMPKDALRPFSFYILSHGEKVFAIYTSDVVTMLQCLVTIVRIVPFLFMLRRHRLHFNRKVYSFLACWTLIIVFVFMISTMSMEEMSSTYGRWFYFSTYSVLIIFVNVLIAMRYDQYPVETADGEIVEDVGNYVQQQYGAMSAHLRYLMEQQKQYLDPQLTAESVIEQLQTNHTYFSQMMSEEWGMSFSEYLNNLRLTNVERLLRDESLTISAAATQSGFSDAGYMSRRFKLKYGVTPSEWRKTLH